MKKLFCIESDWEESVKKETSILPLLECIKSVYPDFEYIYRTANTKEELKYCLSKFKKLSQPKNDFNVIVFCGHGKTGKITLGSGKTEVELSLKELAEICEEIDEDLFKNNLVHFDSCSILKTTNKKLNEFTELTGAKAITGFSEDVDFITSYALEMILFEALLHENSIKKALNSVLKKHEDGLCEITHFTQFI
ncbi:hypothetical protein PM10SUCC1_29670 [Propionigenium maris DSM 9537]|uniref:Uncharacterized protein n=1 Tax=Propionigenium maris DSM 9537 TaxID=1123000 RepID=A0A9W6LP87_9FUSO|nr:DUF6642 family protein [Propionigenium maris]GLI57453.1 hypothetical protein PM10SUCC1_29670 [Propionigenium maris DSM 9537]